MRFPMLRIVSLDLIEVSVAITYDETKVANLLHYKTTSCDEFQNEFNLYISEIFLSSKTYVVTIVDMF